MSARTKPISLHPVDDRRLAALDARVRRRMCVVDDAVSKADKFVAMVDECDHGVVLEPIDEEDSLVIHLTNVQRSIA